MGMLVWAMTAIAIWHFTVFLPDRYWGGIVGAFLGAVTGGILVALAISGFSVPGRDDTEVVTALQAIPGTLVGIGLMYLQGVRRGNEPLHL